MLRRKRILFKGVVSIAFETGLGSTIDYFRDLIAKHG